MPYDTTQDVAGSPEVARFVASDYQSGSLGPTPVKPEKMGFSQASVSNDVIYFSPSPMSSTGQTQSNQGDHFSLKTENISFDSQGYLHRVKGEVRRQTPEGTEVVRPKDNEDVKESKMPQREKYKKDGSSEYEYANGQVIHDDGKGTITYYVRGADGRLVKEGEKKGVFNPFLQ